MNFLMSDPKTSAAVWLDNTQCFLFLQLLRDTIKIWDALVIVQLLVFPCFKALWSLNLHIIFCSCFFLILSIMLYYPIT